MRFFYILLLFSITLTSCKEDKSKITLGEDIEEINAYPKKIYESDGIIYIDIDLVKIEYKNIDERVIVNKNPKIRTYIIDKNTLIYSKDCKTLNAGELLQNSQKILKHNATIAVGKSKKGKMLSINFGCYG